MDREVAYADAVVALLDASPTSAVEQFDAALEQAVDAGLEVSLARTLRWWHRESMRAVRDHAAVVLPPVIAALVASDAAAAGQIAAPPAIAVAPPPVDDEPSPAEEARRRTLVASLRSLNDSATA